MLRKLHRNQHAVEFNQSELKQQFRASKKQAILAANSFWVLKMAMLQLVLVGLPNTPVFALVLLLTLEIFFFGMDCCNYARLKFYQKASTFFVKSLRSAIFILVELCLLVETLRLENRKWQLGIPAQKPTAYFLVAGSMLEYVFLVIVMIQIILELKAKCSKKVTEQTKNEKNDFLVFKEIEKFHRSIQEGSEDFGPSSPSNQPVESSEQSSAFQVRSKIYARSRKQDLILNGKESKNN